jgi:glyoxylase-like metal-dependent hydrolase (beta-lactamase superfamily II)
MTVFCAESGFAKYKVGDIDFYCIQDLANAMDNAIFTDADPDILKKYTQNGKSPSSISTFVIKHNNKKFVTKHNNNKTILVDTGNGVNLLTNLAAAGIKTDEVSDILLTHTHGDHVSGLFRGSKTNFPNATIWITAAELKFWKSSNNRLVEKVIKAYGEFKIIVPDEKSAVVLPEVVAIDAVGHTSGHVAFLVSSKGQKVFVAGDLLHSASLQFPHPEISSRYDSDPKQAAEIRKKLLTRTANEKWIFVSAHIPFPGFIQVEKDGNGFKLSPLNNPTNTNILPKKD